MTPLQPSQKVQKELRRLANKERALHSQGFFKTGPGEYGEGDVFLGLTVPQTRRIVKDQKEIALKDVKVLLKSKYHEERLAALFFLVRMYESKKSTAEEREKIVEFYLQNLRWVNNWDLVDSSAHKILGPHLFTKKRGAKGLLTSMARSENLLSQLGGAREVTRTIAATFL